MIYEIVAYDTKVVPLKTSVCKILISESQTRNSVGVVFHSVDQVRELVNQLKVYLVDGEVEG